MWNKELQAQHPHDEQYKIRVLSLTFSWKDDLGARVPMVHATSLLYFSLVMLEIVGFMAVLADLKSTYRSLMTSLLYPRCSPHGDP